MTCSDGCKLKPGIYTLFLGSDLIFQIPNVTISFVLFCLNVHNLLFMYHCGFVNGVSRKHVAMFALCCKFGINYTIFYFL